MNEKIDEVIASEAVDGGGGTYLELEREEDSRREVASHGRDKVEDNYSRGPEDTFELNAKEDLGEDVQQ